jgi:alkanesulfonate monooxygenase SsuD/methylene tetrahydromethanopterin reductase-like flavin-dependent oxidoreductase (luciferase family)
LAAVAAVTRRITVGPLVLSTPFRHPPMLAKQLAGIEALAPGRLALGLGAGGMTYAKAAAALGFEALSRADRVAHVEETIDCLRTLWRDDPADFDGRFSRARAARIHPRPAGSVPIILAAQGPRMLELTARKADGWSCPRPWGLSEGLEQLERLGRRRDSLDVSVFAIAVLGWNEADAEAALVRAGPSAQLFGNVAEHHVFGGPERAAERIAALQAQGAGQITLDPRGRSAAESIELLVREVLPLLAN